MTNLAIAQAATLRPILDVAAELGLQDEVDALGKHKAKLTTEAVRRLVATGKQGKLVLVTAMTPTPHGEGKTTTCVGLAQGLRKIGRKSLPAIREPALGPIFGVKGGACGGGYSQVVPMEDINLFFTGDFPAVAAAHNLLSAMLDASLHNGNPLRIDARQVTWPRTVDMNDRALRSIVLGLGGTANGVPRESGFVITPASEVMACLGLSRDLADLKANLGRIVVGRDEDNKPVTAAQIGAAGPMAALLRDAIKPNLVQTLEGGPALVHTGPFANIAHGSSSVVGTRCALACADYVVTEGGFASDLGAEKFMDLVAPRLGYGPDAVVLVVTLRAIQHHGEGFDDALVTGFENVRRHLAHLRQYEVPLVVAVNVFAGDNPAELDRILALCHDEEVPAVLSRGAELGGEGCVDLAHAVEAACQRPANWHPLTEGAETIEAKLTAVVTKAYGGRGVTLAKEARTQKKWLEKNGFAGLPVCIAKTQSSLSDDASQRNAPVDFTVTVRELRLSAGAGFIVAVCGDIMLMPGLGKNPAALQIDVDDDGKIVGLF